MHYRKHGKNVDTFCEIWVLTPSFFGTPLRSHYPIFSPQIMQENWLTYCRMEIQNATNIEFSFWDFLCPKIPYFLWTVYKTSSKKCSTMGKFTRELLHRIELKVCLSCNVEKNASNVPVDPITDTRPVSSVLDWSHTFVEINHWIDSVVIASFCWSYLNF